MHMWRVCRMQRIIIIRLVLVTSSLYGPNLWLTPKWLVLAHNVLTAVVVSWCIMFLSYIQMQQRYPHKQTQQRSPHTKHSKGTPHKHSKGTPHKQIKGTPHKHTKGTNRSKVHHTNTPNVHHTNTPKVHHTEMPAAFSNLKQSDILLVMHNLWCFFTHKFGNPMLAKEQHQVTLVIGGV